MRSGGFIFKRRRPRLREVKYLAKGDKVLSVAEVCDYPLSRKYPNLVLVTVTGRPYTQDTAPVFCQRSGALGSLFVFFTCSGL